ncbi:MAG: type VI secretion system ATPase TssH [Fuerstiella sp.]
MVSVNLKSLVARLNDTCCRTLEGAAGFCLSRTNHNVEIEHWLVKLLEVSNSDFEAILKHHGIDHSQLVADLTKALDRLPTGNARPPGLSPDLVHLAREGWMLASVEFGAAVTRSGHLIAALLADETLARIARAASGEFEKINGSALIQSLSGVIANTAESADTGSQGSVSGSDAGPAVKPGGPSKSPALDQFTIDLTARAKAGEIDPIIGRDDEIRQVIDILTRRRQNNPIITGEAGVGKTAAVEGFALRIAAGDVPEPLKNVSLRSLDLSLLQAGAGVKGEFENRLKSVINEVKAAPQPIILFIDEAHTLIGAGGSAGQGDAANLLKPALARGELRTIAATTWAEYKKYFERDAALARRFQVVKVDEPAEPVGIAMIRGMVETLEKHHNVRILDEAVVDAVRLSKRYISGRQLPDKAVSLIDTACARVAIGQFATPASIEDLRRRIDRLNVEIEILNRETVTGADHQERLTNATQDLQSATAELEQLEQQWNQEKKLVSQIRSLRDTLEGNGSDPDADSGGSEAGSDADAQEADTESSLPSDADPETLRKQLAELTAQLDELQGEAPLMQVCVDSQAVADVVSNWTGIPVGRMVSDEINTVLNLREEMEKRVVGQSHGLEAIAQSIRTSRAKMKDPQKPVGVFMLAGPSGVGKTETAITVAELLYGGEQNMTTINMSEFKEEHKVSLLMGSPPGYVGYGEGGVLTEAVRRRPYSVVLLDELEKSHEGVQEVFYQVFDKGMLRDGEGRDIDFKNTVIIMTSNAGTDLIMKLCADPDTMPDAEGLKEALHEELLKTFKPAFLGRCNIIPYFPLGDDVLKGIIELKLAKIVRRVADNYRAELKYGPEVVSAILDRCQEVASGARNVDNIVNGTLLPELSAEFLSRMAESLPISRAVIGVSEDGRFSYDVS